MQGQCSPLFIGKSVPDWWLVLPSPLLDTFRSFFLSGASLGAFVLSLPVLSLRVITLSV